MKILILVLSSKTYPSKRNKNIQKKTWAKNLPKNIKVVFYSSGAKTTFSRDELVVEASSSSYDIGYKNFKAFEWVLKNFEFDYLYRTNTSSFLNLSNLEKHIQNIQNAKSDLLYNGKILNLTKSDTNKKIKFVSGSGILFSKKSIELLTNNQEALNHNEWEDVAIGLLGEELKIVPTEGSRFDIEGNIFNQITPLNQYHYRCRIDNHYGYPRFLETIVMRELNRRHLENKEYNKKFLLSIYFEICKFFYIENLTWKLVYKLKQFLNLFLPKKIYKILKIKLRNKLFQYFFKK